MEKPYYFLSVKSRNVAVRIGLNDVPLAVDPTGQGLNADYPLNAWLLQEGNIFTVQLLWPPKRPFKPGEAVVEAVVYLSDPASLAPKPLETLATFAWPTPNVPEAYPHRKRTPVQGTAPMATKLWTEASALTTLTPEDRTAIMAEVEKLRGLLEKSDPEGTYQMMAYKVTDLARANHHDPAEMAQISTEQLSRMLSTPELVVTTVKEPVFEIVGQNKVVRVNTGTGAAAVVLQGKTVKFGFELYFSKIAGKWTIVR